MRLRAGWTLTAASDHQKADRAVHTLTRRRFPNIASDAMRKVSGEKAVGRHTLVGDVEKKKEPLPAAVWEERRLHPAGSRLRRY